MGKRRDLFVAAPLVVVLLVSGSSEAVAAGGTPANVVAAAIDAVPLDLLRASAGVVASDDADSVAVTINSGTTVDIPRAADGVVRVSSEGQSGARLDLGLELPDPGAASPGGVSVAPGIVAYPTGTTHANGVQADEQGAVRLLTVINGSAAPEEYHYELDLPEGSSTVKDKGGNLIVSTPQGQGIIQAPWAFNARGNRVWTQFLTDGASGVDLIVNHWGEPVAYPITADPAVVLGAFVVAFTFVMANALRGCALGALSGAAQQAFFHGWVWNEVVRAGAEGCVWGLLGGFRGFVRRW
ncbi:MULTISPECIES: hypothetical protein [Actinosynnema]|uniref:hypothetical protein n=1 Tax=Actinosynnema TaxID=40566 RepID=UPI0020A460A4|nr:hypothetical protein [Actinosynnema pretiosum]MCP2097622.1 hypothetical protein [Actinosynnema pretiosum]